MSEFIILNTCYSQQLGDILLENKIAKHVICFNKNEILGDKLAIIFSNYFFKFVMQGINICESFKKTKTLIIDKNPEYLLGIDNYILLIKHKRNNCNLNPILYYPVGIAKELTEYSKFRLIFDYNCSLDIGENN